jgi:hypothetical protein
VTAGPDGVFSWSPPAPLSDGAWTVSAATRGGNGLEGVATTSFTVDATPPALVVREPAEDATVVASTIGVMGEAEVGTTVTVLTDGLTLGTVDVRGVSVWRLPPMGISSGAHVLTVVGRDKAGNAAIVTRRFQTVSPPPAGEDDPPGPPDRDGEEDADGCAGGGTSPSGLLLGLGALQLSRALRRKAKRRA